MAPAKAAPPGVLLSGPVLGGIVGSMLCVTTFLYLNHDREAKEWREASASTSAQRTGMWPPSTADFNWCEPDYVYTPFVMELWNSLTSLCFVIGPILTWRSAGHWEVRLNLLLVAGIGLGSAAFHATLQYEAQLLDELPMIFYVAHTTALLAREDVDGPRRVYSWSPAAMATFSSSTCFSSAGRRSMRRIAMATVH